jgi:hypothetical protein
MRTCCSPGGWPTQRRWSASSWLTIWFSGPSGCGCRSRRRAMVKLAGCNLVGQPPGRLLRGRPAHAMLAGWLRRQVHRWAQASILQLQVEHPAGDGRSEGGGCYRLVANC